MSLSLSELIYGSHGSQNNETEAPKLGENLDRHLDQDAPRKGPILRSQTNRKRKRVKIEVDEEVDRYYSETIENSNSTLKQPKTSRTKYDFETNVEERLFYGASSKVEITRSSQDTISVKKKKVYDPITGRYISVLDETEEEQQIRLLKLKERIKRYKRLNLTAKWNFRQEIDVGHAIKYMADMGRKTEKKQDDIRPVKIRKKMRKNFNGDNRVGDDRTKKLKGPLHSQQQLDNLISRAKALDQTVPSTPDAKKDPSHPLHYVWLGFCAPFWRQLGGSYFARLKEIYGSTAPCEKERYIILKILLNTFTRHPQDFKVTQSRCIMPKVLCMDNSQYLRTELAIQFWNLTHDYNIRKCPEVYHSKRKKFLRPRLSDKNMSGDSIQEEAKKVLSMVSRYVAGCASLSSSPGQYEHHFEHMLRLLHNMPTSIDHTRSVVRQCQTVASNWVLWNELYPRMKLLCSKGILSIEDFFIIRKELLSSFSEFFSDPCMTANYEDCSHIGERRRHRIFDFIERLNRGRANEKFSSSANPWILSHTERLAKNVKICDMPYSHGVRYSKVVHSTPISLGTIHVALCFLFSSMDLAINDNATTQEIVKMRQEIDDYLSKLAGIVWNKNDGDIPIKFHRLLLSAPLAYVTQMKQSFISNLSFSENVAQDDRDFNYAHYDAVDSSLDDNQSAQKNAINFKHAASNLASYGQSLSRDGKLEIFHQIHLTTAVATIASCFGPHGAEILSRPIFTGSDTKDTPFDLVRFALEDAAKKGYIRRNATSISYNEHVIYAEELIRGFETAAEMFRDILNHVPYSIDCRCWYTATRVGAMIVASGIQIGNGSRVASPDEYNMEDYPIDDVSRHSEYNTLRSLASEAMRELLAYKSSSNLPSGHRYHYAMKSILEWKEVVGLLILRPHLNMDSFKTIKLLHAKHTTAWAMNECSDEAFTYVMTLAQHGFVSLKDILVMLTRLIDRNPNDIIAWATLASALASTGRTFSRSWARHIIPYWKTHYFTLQPNLIPQSHLPLSCAAALTAVQSHLQAGVLGDGTRVKGKPNKTTVWSTLKQEIQYKHHGKDWLWPTTFTDEDEDDHMEWIDDEGEMILLDDHLPGDLGQSSKDVGITCFDDIIIPMRQNELFFLASKAIVSNALYGKCTFVNFVVDLLVHKCTTTTTTTGSGTSAESVICINKTCDAINLLECLIRAKVDVIQILNHLLRSHQQVKHKKSKKRKFPFRFETF